jgi:hypothetical protein
MASMQYDQVEPARDALEVGSSRTVSARMIVVSSVYHLYCCGSKYMTETHCYEERFTAMVTFDRLRLAEERHSDLVAALVKTIAQYTGGLPAAAAAYGEDLSTPLGMRFVFVDRSSRDLFWRRVIQCLDPVTQDALMISPLGAVDDITAIQSTLQGPALRNRANVFDVETRA